MPDANHADDALGPLVHRSHPRDGGAAVAGAIDADSLFIDLGLEAEKCHGGLYVSYPAIRDQPVGGDTFAIAPALVVKGHDDVAGLVQDAGVVGQVQVFDTGVPVAQEDG